MISLGLKKEQIHVISAVTFGNVLEWFDVYSYAYLAPILSKVFFGFRSDLFNLISSFIIFGSGFLARPIGAILFGRLGDLMGRKTAFVLSITVMTVPTFAMGFLPTYAQVGVYAPLLLAFLRLLQSVPAAGESPGAFCFLYENAGPKNKKFMTSWGAVGNQLGAILAIFETALMDNFFSHEFLMSWGWRISFWTGGAIGLLGIYLRRTLHETPTFKELKSHHRIDHETVTMLILNHKKDIILGTGFGVLNAATFYLIASYIPTYFDEMIGLSLTETIFTSLAVLLVTTIPLPLFGILGDRFSNKAIFIICTISIVALLFPLYAFINSSNLPMIAVTGFFFLVPITCMTALLPYLLAHLFPAPVRFTGVGIAFNLADGIVGGFTPAIALFLLNYTNNQGAFCWFILLCAIVSLFSYFRIKDRSLSL